MTYARARLWLGISGVGALVVLSVLGLSTDLPVRVLPAAHAPFAAQIGGLGAFVAAYVLWSLPFDVAGGWGLPRRFGLAPTLSPRRWLRAVAVHGGAMFAALAVLLTLSRTFGPQAGALGFGALALAFPLLQRPLARLMGALRPSDQDGASLHELREGVRRLGLDPGPLRLWEHADRGFTGGIAGWGNGGTVIAPRRWLELSPTVAIAMVARRLVALRSGMRRRGLVSAMLFNLVGFSLALNLPGAGLQSAAELVHTSLGFTLWSFVGLLVLPSWSRAATYALDRETLAEGVSVEALEQSILTQGAEPEGEERRHAAVESIFHPAPSTQLRLERLAQSEAPRGTSWHVARTALAASWLAGGLLSRAVHCNCGRPELWVMLPTD